MALFLSTQINKLDKKGRVSIPAQFRTELADQSFQGVVLLPSKTHKALEGFSWSYMHSISERLDAFDLFSSEQDDLATSVFGLAQQLPFDGDGRITLPSDLIAYAGITEQVGFVGLGHKFQVWDPVHLEERKQKARQAVQDNNLTIPKGQVA